MKRVYVVRTYGKGCQSAFVNISAYETWAEAWEQANQIDTDHAADLIDELPMFQALEEGGDE